MPKNEKRSRLGRVRRFAEKHYPQERLETLEQQIVENQNTLLMLGGVFTIGVIVGAILTSRGRD